MFDIDLINFWCSLGSEDVQELFRFDSSTSCQTHDLLKCRRPECGGQLEELSNDESSKNKLRSNLEVMVIRFIIMEASYKWSKYRRTNNI